MKRRDFLKKASAATAAGIVIPTIVPSSVLGMNGATPPSDQLVMGAVGLGGMGKGNMTALLKTGKTRFIAVCDLDEKRRNEARNALGKYYENKKAATAYEDFEEMFESHNFDAVTIAVPDQWHAPLYTYFASKKIHIYGEKPLTRSIYEGQKVVESVKKNGITWQTGSWQRSQGNFRKAAELVAQGAIGKIQRVEVGLPNFGKKVGMPPIQDTPAGINYDRWVGPSKFMDYRGILHWDWRWMQNYSAGQLTDWGAHHIDIALWALEMDRTGPTEIEGQASFSKGDLFDVAHEFDIHYKLPGNIPMKVSNASKAPKGMGTVWYGENGWIHVNRKETTASAPAILETPIKNGGKLYDGAGDHRKNFVDCVFSGKEPIAHIEAAHRANSCSLLGEIAFMTGEKLKWDPKKEKLIGASAEANARLKRDFRNPYKLY